MNANGFNKSEKAGEPAPNFTQCPNVFFDDWLQRRGDDALSCSEMRVMLALIRQTFGWHRSSAALSLGQIQKLSGLSRQGTVDGVNAAIAAGFVSKEEVDGQTVYSLLVVNTVDCPEAVSSLIRGQQAVYSVDQPSYVLNKGVKEREEDVQRCTPARPSSPSSPKPEPPTDPLIAAVAAACPRASIGSAASGKAIAWLKQHGKSPEWVAGCAEWFAAEHDDWDNPQPNPSQLIGAAEAYDAWLDVEAEELRRRQAKRAQLQADTAARQAELEQAKARSREAFEARFGPVDQVDWKALIAAKRAEREAAEAAEGKRRSVPVWQIPAMVKRYGGGADA